MFYGISRIDGAGQQGLLMLASFHLISQVESKFLLSVGGVTLVLLSTTATFGSYGYIGVPATLLVMQVSFFFVHCYSWKCWCNIMHPIRYVSKINEAIDLMTYRLTCSC